MCGIAGLIHRGKSSDVGQELQSMLQALKHRGPDSTGYALYAENANINYDSISNLLSNDSTFITTVGGGMGGDGCDIKFPEGLDGDAITFTLSSATTYTVPSGKRLYILKGASSGAHLEIDGLWMHMPQHPLGLIINSGQVLSCFPVNNSTTFHWFQLFL